MTTTAHDTWTFMGRILARIQGLFSLLHGALVDARETRSRLEADLFRNRYRISSKNDDDLPAVH